MYVTPRQFVHVARDVYPYPWAGPYSNYERWLRSGTFAGMGDCGCASSIDPRSAPVWSNTYRLATAGALNRVGGLGEVNISGNLGLYLVAFAIPPIVFAILFGLGIIKLD